MNRGFLKTKKAKRRIAKAVDSESTKGGPHKNSKDKANQGERLDVETRAEQADFSTIDPHKLPKSVQEQNDNDTHSVGYGKKRMIFRLWPRDPKGLAIKPSSLRGKEAGNGIDLWGATLYDFYHVRRLPNVPNFITNSSGSRLAKWMRQAGELIAQDELFWADKEEDPKEIPVADIGELIGCYDTRVNLGILDQYSSRKEIREKAKSGLCGSSYIAEIEDGGDSIPPVSDQDDNTDKDSDEDSDEDAVEDSNEDSVKDSDEDADEHSDKGKDSVEDSDESATTSVQLHEAMQVDEASVPLNEAMQVDEVDETSPEKGADQPKVQPAAPLPNIDSPFHPDHYPSPHPFIPCTHEDNPTLQQRIPLHLLPQKLYVHDPWNKLSIGDGDSDRDTPWLSKVAKREVVRTYSLSLSPEGKEKALKEQKLAEIAEDEATKGESLLHIFPSDKEGPTEDPLIEVRLPPRPRKRTQVEEAHLYLPSRPMGVGNHSVVYATEWELPRDVFIQSRMCRVCVESDARQQVQKLKDEGKWEELLKNTKGRPEEMSEAGPDVAPGTELSETSGAKRTVGYVTIEERRLPAVTGAFIKQEDLESEQAADAHFLATTPMPNLGGDPPADTISHAAEAGGTETDVTMDAVDGQDQESGAKVDREEAPNVEMKVDDSKEPSALESASREDKGKGKEEPEQGDEDEEKADSEESEEEELFTIEPARVVRLPSYTGPCLRIYTNVKWRGPTEGCCHVGGLGSGPVPRTATLRVIAKLSIQHDLHLDREASNYQSFPDHFFQHWNGYNVMPPLHDPVPVGALCPQFYGYYTPDDPSDGTGHPDYLSPILLLEYCGQEINPDELCLDDRQECASLVFRFHHAGWLHESFAARNILWQQGKPTEWPIQRPYSSKSFRLIDFGRSKKLDKSITRANEEETASRLLRLFHHAGM